MLPSRDLTQIAGEHGGRYTHLAPKNKANGHLEKNL